MELAVASAAMLVVLGTFTGIMSVFLRTSTDAVNSENAATQLRLGILELERDVQAANPLDAPPPGANPADQLTVTLGPSGHQQQVTWALDPTAGTLSRQVGSATPVVEIAGITNGTSLPVFSYYGQSGANLLDPQIVSPSQLPSCTVRVQVSIGVLAPGRVPFSETVNIELANQRPGALTCG